MGVILEQNSYEPFLKNVLNLSIESIMVSYLNYPSIICNLWVKIKCLKTGKKKLCGHLLSSKT